MWVGGFTHVISPLSNMTTKVHSRNTVKTKKCKLMNEYI